VLHYIKEFFLSKSRRKNMNLIKHSFIVLTGRNQSDRINLIKHLNVPNIMARETYVLNILFSSMTLKIIFIDYVFRLPQILENIFGKIFYVETNKV
jgi:hypothetical protein